MGVGAWVRWGRCGLARWSSTCKAHRRCATTRPRAWAREFRRSSVVLGPSRRAAPPFGFVSVAQRGRLRGPQPPSRQASGRGTNPSGVARGLVPRSFEVGQIPFDLAGLSTFGPVCTPRHRAPPKSRRATRARPTVSCQRRSCRSRRFRFALRSLSAVLGPSRQCPGTSHGARGAMAPGYAALRVRVRCAKGPTARPTPSSTATYFVSTFSSSKWCASSLQSAGALSQQKVALGSG